MIYRVRWSPRTYSAAQSSFRPWWIRGIPALSSTVAVSNVWLRSTRYVTTVTEQLVPEFRLILISWNLHLNSHIWLVATAGTKDGGCGVRGASQG